MRAFPLALLLAAAVAVPLAVPTDAPAAQTPKTKVDATYEISIAGWAIARASLDLEIQNGSYSADLFMRPKGVARIVTAVQTSVSASGQVKRGDVQPTRYRVRAAEVARPVAVDMTLRSGTVTDLRAVPPLKERDGRIPITNKDKRGIVDPLSSGLIPIRTADAHDACNHTMEIFDGWTRYDVRLYYKRQAKVETKGYSGTAAVCGARWVPVAGHRPAKQEVQYLANNKALEMWVVPIPGEDVAIPYRVSIGTPNGEILIEPSALDISIAGV